MHKTTRVGLGTEMSFISERLVLRFHCFRFRCVLDTSSYIYVKYSAIYLNAFEKKLALTTLLRPKARHASQWTFWKQED
jgi:hypothetical protein